MKRILVTGGAGFLGLHLCERFLQRVHDVICADNCFSGNKGNLAHLLENQRFEVTRHDIAEPRHLYFGQSDNLACPASPVHYQMDPIHTIKTSVLGAIHMLVKLAEQVLRISGLRSRLVRRPLPCDDPKYRCPDIAPARSAFGREATAAPTFGTVAGRP